MRPLTLAEVLELHRLIIASSGGSPLVRDLNALQPAVAQPRMTFGGQNLYPSLTNKATAPCFSIVANHPFVDGYKRNAHAAPEAMLVLNGFEPDAQVDNQEKLFLSLAAGADPRDRFAAWRAHEHTTRSTGADWRSVRAQVVARIQQSTPNTPFGRARTAMGSAPRTWLFGSIAFARTARLGTFAGLANDVALRGQPPCESSSMPMRAL